MLFRAIAGAILSFSLILASIAPAEAASPPCSREQKKVVRAIAKDQKKLVKIDQKVAKKALALDKIDRQMAVVGAQQAQYAIMCALGQESACRKLTRLLDKLARYEAKRADTAARYDAQINDQIADEQLFYQYELVPAQVALEQCLASQPQ